MSTVDQSLQAGQRHSLQAARATVATDIHQPQHAADNGDYGGNGAVVANRSCVEFGSSQPTACKLHTYWITSLAKGEAVGDKSDPEAATAWAAALGALPAADSDSPADWANESTRLAKTTVYAFDAFACRDRRASMMAAVAYDAQGVATVKRQIRSRHKVAIRPSHWHLEFLGQPLNEVVVALADFAGLHSHLHPVFPLPRIANKECGLRGFNSTC